MPRSRTHLILLASLVCLAGCITTRLSLTPEAKQVAYVEGAAEPHCESLGDVTVGREYFVTDERQPAQTKGDLVVRMRRLAAKMGGNLVVISENDPPSSKCSGFNGAGQVYRCDAATLAKLPGATLRSPAYR
jgi:hypothetical protein